MFRLLLVERADCEVPTSSCVAVEREHESRAGLDLLPDCLRSKQALRGDLNLPVLRDEGSSGQRREKIVRDFVGLHKARGHVR